MGTYRESKKTIPATASIVVTRLVEDNEYSGPPDKHNDGFWPSHDKKSPGYVLPEDFEEQQANAEKRMARYEAGAWNYVGVRAKAIISIPIGRRGDVCTYTLKSAGLWGVESDSEEQYLQEVFEEQAAELVEHIKQFAGACENVTVEKE